MVSPLLRFVRDSLGTSNVTAENGSAEFSCLNDTSNSSTITVPTFWATNKIDRYATIIIAAIISVYFVVAFAWNLFIILTYLIKHRLLKEPANIFLFTLAIVDFVVTITIMLYTIIILAANKFVFGESDQSLCAACSAFGYIFVFLIAVSNHTLVALSVDRFILLAWPLRYKSFVTKWKALVVVVVIWIWSLLLALPPLVGFGLYEFNQRLGVCIPRFSGERNGVKNVYYLIVVVLDVLFCLFILFITNVWTYKIIKKFLQRNLIRRRSFRDTTAGESAEDQRYQSQQQQLIKVFSALFVAHLVSWTPFIVVLLIFLKYPDIPNVVFVLGWLCYLTHPVLQPIIETFFVKDLRYEVRRVNTGVRQSIVSVGSAIMRASQVAFASDTLDRANQAVDVASNGQGGRKSKLHKKPSDLSFEESVNASTVTECMEMGTPTPELHRHDYTSSPAGSQKKLERRITITWSDQGTSSDVEMSLKVASMKNGLHESVIEERDENASQDT